MDAFVEILRVEWPTGAVIIFYFFVFFVAHRSCKASSRYRIAGLEAEVTRLRVDKDIEKNRQLTARIAELEAAIKQHRDIKQGDGSFDIYDELLYNALNMDRKV
ncbi:MAG: hypothetical protein IPK72_21225 [Candidatus Eisenbacteria bacterium]|nr:hypothetical protein [Candidatus Eisenbacteria bacterium]